MPEVYIPFTKGQSEAVDAKLLPQGLFVSAQNVRYAKDARLAARAAYRASAASGAPTPANVVGAASFASNHELLLTKRASLSAPAFATRHAVGLYRAGSSSVAPYSSSISSLGVPTRYRAGGGLLPTSQAVGSCDTVISGNNTFVAWSAYAIGGSDVAGLFVHVFDTASGALVGTISVGGNGDVQPHLLVLNGLVCVFYGNTIANTVKLNTIDPTTFAQAIIGTVVTAVAGSARYFDISDGASATSGYLVYQSAANTLTFGTVTAGGVFVALNTVATTQALPLPAICAGGLNPTDDVCVAWNDGSTISNGVGKYTIYRRSTGLFPTATTTYAGVGTSVGYPVAGPDGTNDVIVATNLAANVLGVTSVAIFPSVTGLLNRIYGQRLASKPFIAGNGAFLVLTDQDAAGATPPEGTYYVYDANAAISAFIPNSAQCEAVFCVDGATPANAAAQYADPRRRLVASAAVGSEVGLSAIVGALPVLSGVDSGFDLFRFEYGDRAEAFLSAKLNNQTILSGPRIVEYDGQAIVESGFVGRPTLSATTAAGLIPAGTYQYVGVWEWFDGGGRRHLSAPSLPITVTLTVASNITIAFDAPRATSKNPLFLALGAGTAGSNHNAKLKLYRTAVAPGTIFRDVVGYAVAVAESGTFYVDSTLDAALASREILYTQGAQGGLSGLLEHNPPPAARYIWAGSDRLIVGGLERRSAVQWSLLRVESEPIQWSNYDGLKAQVDGVVTAVAEMDGTWFIATYNNWWQVVGQGPDNNGAGGSFDSPRRLPSDIGCISAKSLLLTGKGLMFQGRSDGMFLLPRGGGEPIPIGWQVRDTLAAFPNVAASAFDQDSNVAYWAVVDATASSGRLIVFDTRLGEWYVDNFLSRAIKTLSIYNGLLVIDGAIVETPGNYQDSDGSTTASVVPSLTTGDVRPFGMTGRGKARKIQLEGEARDVTTAFSVTLDVSYDSGVSFTEPVSWPIASLAAGVGGAIEGAEHTLKYPKGDKWRFRLSWSTPSATEGIVWSGLSLEIFQERGLQRVANSRRA